MANAIELTTLDNKHFVDSTSRYINARTYYYGNQRLITFETYKQQKIRFQPNDKFYMVTKGTEFRPDLVANQAYGISSLWWKIMEANDIKDIFDFKAGTNIRIPGI